MIHIWTVVAILFWHWFADFFCQTHKMSMEKSKDNRWLSVHVLVYTEMLTIGLLFTLGPYHLMFNFLIFVPLTFAAHWCQDYVTSRITSRLYKAGQFHWFFVVIGIDQFLHYLQLLWTFEYCRYA